MRDTPSDGVREQGPRGAHLEAFFGCLYYAAMRPAEATALSLPQCHLPETGWDADTAARRRTGGPWLDERRAGARAAAPQGASGQGLPAGPHPTALVRTLRQHIATHGTAPDGRLFRTNRGGLLHETGYGEVWAQARKDVLTEAETASLLARRPYDLRHAGVSIWHSSGVDPMECARRAGHTIAVLFQVYAKVLAQTQDRANRRIDKALREWNQPE
jgi:integrase